MSSATPQRRRALSAPDLRGSSRVEAAPSGTTLHIVRGLSWGPYVPADRSGEHGPEDVICDVDTLSVGPAPAVGAAAFRQIRRGLWQRNGERIPRRWCAGALRLEIALGSPRAWEHITIWARGHLDDQLFLIRCIAQLADDCPPAHIKDIGFEPGHRAPVGDGPGSGPVTDRHRAVAREVWTAFVSPCPADLARVSRVPHPEFPHLQDALHRLIQRYPCVRDGLSVVPRTILRAVERRPRPMVRVLVACLDMAQSESIGDITVADEILTLLRARQPLLSGPPVPKHGERALYVLWSDKGEITEMGRRVLAGELDACALALPDRWVGGVHITDGRWRYDPAQRTLVDTWAT